MSLSLFIGNLAVGDKVKNGERVCKNSAV
jgi:hypothetical protein